MKLTEGLLWCDVGKPIEQMVLEAADAYQHKHGVRPDTCLIRHDLADKTFNVDGIIVILDSRIAPHHLLIGVTNETPDRSD